ncbi:MAG: substrate-binding domain-containing protein, partial [Anaerolineae bacterium]|nr:substrate-binding domain-containing protein [Anaerolineae bacterium]
KENPHSPIIHSHPYLQIHLTCPSRSATKPRSVLLLIQSRLAHGNGDVSAKEISAELERSVIAGAQPVLEAHGIIARVVGIKYEDQDVQPYASDPTIAGLIFIGGLVNRSLLHNLLTTSVPFIVAGSHVRPLRASSVMGDYHHGMEQAVTHLIERGRRHIGLVNGPDTTTSSAEKFRGYRLALALHELPFEPAYVVSSEFSMEASYRQTLRLLEQAPHIDAIAFAEDHMAVGGLRALREMGRRVPDDVAITGFYDHEISLFTDPALTSVHFDIPLMGRVAAQQLCMMIQDPHGASWDVVLPTQLVVRDST